MLGQKNITHIVVGKDVAPVGETSTRASMTVGQIGVFKIGSTTAIDGTTDLTAGDKFQVVYKDVDGYLVESPMISYDNIISKQAVAYAADAEQKTYIGYNGTTGSITVANSSDYYIHLDRKDQSKTWGEYNLYKLVAAYKSDSTATQTEIADALVANAYKNLLVEKQRSGRWVTQVGRISSDAVTAGHSLDHNATVVIGTNTITVATNLQYNTAGGTLAVGDYLRIGTVGGGTALTSNVYKVTAINSLVVTLDVEVLEASGTYATATDDIEVITAAQAAAANWGLMFQSYPVKFVPGLFKNQQVTFNVSLSEAFGSTLETVATAPSKGNGTYEEVAEIEWLLRGNRGEPFRVASYPVNKNLNATSGKTYDTISVHYYNNNSSDLDHDVKSWGTLLIFTEDESSATAHTDLKDVLNIS